MGKWAETRVKSSVQIQKDRPNSTQIYPKPTFSDQKPIFKNQKWAEIFNLD